MRIFGHQIDEKNPAEIGEVEGEENEDGKMREVNACSPKSCANIMLNCILIIFIDAVFLTTILFLQEAVDGARNGDHTGTPTGRHSL